MGRRLRREIEAGREAMQRQEREENERVRSKKRVTKWVERRKREGRKRRRGGEIVDEREERMKMAKKVKIKRVYE